MFTVRDSLCALVSLDSSLDSLLTFLPLLPRVRKVASDVAYAHAHGIIVGYYVLLQASCLCLADCSTVCEKWDTILSSVHSEPPWDDRGR